MIYHDKYAKKEKVLLRQSVNYVDNKLLYCKKKTFVI